jgi:hypothetical protein
MSYHIAEDEYDDERLIRYLIGSLDEQDSERCDELSITDGRFADRLRAVEDDLVDAYARGELSGVRLEQFRSAYQASPARRDKVRFAEALFERQPALISAASPAVRRVRLAPGWAMAAAALLVVGSGYLLFQQTRTAPVQQAVAPEPVRAPASPQDTPLPPRTEVSPLPSASPAAPTPAPVLAFTLLPPTRGVGAPPIVTMTRGAREADFHVVLESDDFQSYGVALKDPGADRVMWRSGRLNATTLSGNRVVVVRLDNATSLPPRNYVLELTGLPAAGEAELVASYPFQLVLR